MWWILKAFHKSRGSRVLSTHGGNLMFYLKTWKITKVESGCFPPPTMMKCREIIAGTGLAGAAQAAASVKKGRVFFISHPNSAGAGRRISIFSVTCLFVKLFLNRITEAESSPDWTVVSVLLSRRYVSDAGDSDRCWWPHLRQQRQAGVQHSAGTTLLLCGASDRWGWKRNRHCSHQQASV